MAFASIQHGAIDAAAIDVSSIAARRVRAAIIDRLYALPIQMRLLTMPPIVGVAVALWGHVAPWWVFVLQVALFTLGIAVHWPLRLWRERRPDAFTPAGWHALIVLAFVAATIVNGAAVAYYVSLPGLVERQIAIFGLCLMVSMLPTRALDVWSFGATNAALLLPPAAVVFALDPSGRPTIGILSIAVAYIVVMHIGAHFARVAERRRIGQDLARADAARALDRAEESLRTILDNLGDGVFRVDAQHRVTYANRPMYRLHDVADADAARMCTVEDAVRLLAESGDLPYQPGERNVEDVVARVVRNLWLWPPGEVRYAPRGDKILEYRYIGLPDGGLLGLHRDVTELKRQEQALAREKETAEAARLEAEQVRDELAEMRRRMATVLDTMTDGAALFDAGHRIAYINPAAERMVGVGPGAMRVGRRLDDIIVAQMEAGDHIVRDGVRLGLEQRLALAFGPGGSRYDRMLPSGRHVEFSYQPLKGGDTLAIFRDITELKAQQAELERAREEAEAANQAKSTFLATMSHEIRTPMNGVLGMMEVLDGKGMEGEQRAVMATMRESGRALLRIIDDVLDFSKIEAGVLELEDAPFSLSAVVEGTIRALKPRAERRGLTLIPAIAAGSVDALVGDVTRVQQILYNLVSNALKFTERGGAIVSARSEPAPDGRIAVTLTVNDTGIGLSAEQQARLFQPFSQADSSTTRRYGGSGLGLSIVRRLARSMDGDITVKSALGEGATFTVTLKLRPAGAADGGGGGAMPVEQRQSPIAPAGARVEPAAPVPDPAGEPDDEALVRLRSRRALVVDDHPVNREVLVRQLEVLGIQSDAVDDGLAAVRAWQTGVYAMVFADVHMPVMDGFAMTAEIRRLEAQAGKPRTPIVAVTANAMKGEDERCRDAGMDDYIAKPVNLRVLRQSLQRAARMIEQGGSGLANAAC